METIKGIMLLSVILVVALLPFMMGIAYRQDSIKRHEEIMAYWEKRKKELGID